MARPAQVEKQIAEANRIAEQIGLASKAQEEVQEEQQAAAPEQNEVREESQPEAEVQAAASEPNEPPPPPSPQPTDIEDSFEQKYRVLKGKYDAEVPRLHNEVRATREELNGLRNIMAGLTEIREEAKDDKELKEAVKQYVSEEEVEEYGRDFYDFIKRTAMQASQAEIEKLRQENAQLRQQMGVVGTRVEQSDREKFYRELDSRLKNWQDVNRDPQFISWLEEKDPFSGIERKALLRRHYDAMNASSVLAIFNGYLKENEALTQAPTPEPPQPVAQQQPQQRRKAVTMETLVAPGAPARGHADAPKGKSDSTWTEAQIASFYSDVQKGKFRDRPEDKKRIENEIHAAVMEGRVVSPHVPISNAAY